MQRDSVLQHSKRLQETLASSTPYHDEYVSYQLIWYSNAIHLQWCGGPKLKSIHTSFAGIIFPDGCCNPVSGSGTPPSGTGAIQYSRQKRSETARGDARPRAPSNQGI